MRRKLFLAIIALTICTTQAVFSQIDLLTGVEKGSYWQMGTDMFKTLGDITTIRTDTTKTWDEKNDSVSTSVKRTPMLNVLTTKGSAYNFYRVCMDPHAEIAFMQYDVLLDAQLEDIKKYTKKTDSILMLAPLGYEEIHLLTLKTNKIFTLADLKGKQVAVGAAGMGTAITAKFIKAKTGVQWIDVQLAPKDAINQLLSGRVDAMFFVGSAPVPTLNSLTPAFEKLKFIPLKEKALEEYYSKVTIPKGTYSWLKDLDIETYAVRSVLVCNIKKETIQDKKNYKVFLTSLKNNLDKLQEKGHPAWKRVDFDFSTVRWEIHPIAKEVFGLE
jgi:uncharacterized protein